MDEKIEDSMSIENLLNHIVEDSMSIEDPSNLIVEDSLSIEDSMDEIVEDSMPVESTIDEGFVELPIRVGNQHFDLNVVDCGFDLNKFPLEGAETFENEEIQQVVWLMLKTFLPKFY